jgi:hypothetical protein
MSAHAGSLARGAGSRPAAELEPRVRALEECCTHILVRLDQAKDDMDRYYHAFLELEGVVSQTANSQNELIKNVRALRRPREPAPESAAGAAEPGAAGAAEPGAAGAAEPGARERKWRGVVCAHGQRRYRCRHADCIKAGKERAAREPPKRARVSANFATLEKHQQVSSAQLPDELSVLKGQMADIASALRPSP